MIEEYFHKLFQKLFVSPAVATIRTVKQRVQEEDGYLRIKCRLQNGQRLEFAEYVQVHDDDIIVITYNYQWQDAHGGFVKRWDYDFIYNNPRNPDVRGVPLKRIRELFPFGKIDSWRITLAPPISRRITRIHPVLYHVFNTFYFLRTHVLCWISKSP
jgi:hypothetical protein